MKKRNSLELQLPVLLMFVLAACSAAGPSTESPTLQAIPDTSTPSSTLTLEPTATLQSTATPDVVATQKAEEFQSLLADFKEKGYLGTADGESVTPPNFEGEFAQIHDYYKWWPFQEGQYNNFVFMAHLEWKSYSSTPDVSGCGIGFGIKENGDHYALFLDRENLVLFRGKGSSVYLMGTAGGKKYPKISIPAKADLAVAVWDQNVTVSVNGIITYYILSSDQNAQGQVAFSVLAGTSSGYGTHCEMSDIVFWTPK